MAYNTPQMDVPEYQEALKAFAAGTIVDASRTDLQRYLVAIACNATGDDAVQARDTIQALTLNHLVLQRHIDTLDRKNKVTQRLVIGLTVASLAGTVVQSWLAYKADTRSEFDLARQTATQLVVPQSASSASSSLQPPSAPLPAPKSSSATTSVSPRKSVYSGSEK
jgi:hypothetical protein